MKKCLILANGKPPSKSLLKQSLAESDFFLCADGGANIAARYNFKPDFIIGDFDSISPATIKKFGKIKSRGIASQHSTDLEKAFAWGITKGFQEFIVLGATGGRGDHLAGNLSALGKFSQKAIIKFFDEDGVFQAVGKHMKLTLPVGTTISLIPLARCEGITTTGLRWNLNNDFLELGVRESTSNEIASTNAAIEVNHGNLLLFSLHPQKKKSQR